MQIEIWADVANPWTHVAAERLRAALATADAPAEAVWRPLLADAADPDAPHDALRLLVLAEDHGGPALQNRVATELLASHDIRDRAELAAVADRAGFPAGGKLLDSDAGRRRLRELLLIGKARGIGVSPTLAVGDRHLEFAMSPATITEFLAAGTDDVRVLPEEVRRLRWAEELVALGDHLGALVLLGPLLEDHGQDPNLQQVAAVAYFGSAQLGRAETVLREMLAAHPDDSYACVMLGKTLKRQGRAAEAETHLRMAAAMNPDYA